MSNQPNTHVQLLLSRSSGSGPAQFTLHITDRDSGIDVMDVTLTSEQFADLMSSRITAEGVPAWFVQEGRENIGRHPAAVFRRFDYGEAMTEERLAEWADQVSRFFLLGTTTKGPRRKGGIGGFEVIFTRFFDTLAEAEEWREQADGTLRNLPAPARLASKNTTIERQGFDDYVSARSHAWALGCVGATYNGTEYLKTRDDHSIDECAEYPGICPKCHARYLDLFGKKV